MSGGHYTAATAFPMSALIILEHHDLQSTPYVLEYLSCSFFVSDCS